MVAIFSSKVSCPETEELQQKVSLISEMFHTSSLLHDDVIDAADLRRGKQSVNTRWSSGQAVMSGVNILSVSMRLLAETGHPDVIQTMTTCLDDLVCGELQQMMTRYDNTE